MNRTSQQEGPCRSSRYRFSKDFLINIEQFGGLLLERGGTPAWEVDPYHACFMKALALSGDIDFAAGAPATLLGDTDFRPDLSYLCGIGALEPVSDEAPVQTYDPAEVLRTIEDELGRARRRSGLRAPTTLTLYPDMHCQQKCDFCFLSNEAKEQPRKSTPAQWVDLIRQARDLGVASIALLGGEPTLYPGLVEIIEVCQALDINLGITSNGLHIPDAVVAAIRQSPHTMFCFSIESMDSVRHRLHTGVDNRAVIRTIQHFGAEGIPFNVNTVGLGQPLEDLHAIADFCAGNGAKIWFMNVYFTKGPCPEPFPGFDWYAATDAALREYIQRYEGRLEYQMFGCQLYWTYSPERLRRGSRRTTYNRMISGCAAGINQLEILPDGTALPCIQMDPAEFACGNVFEQGLEAVWTHAPMLKALRDKTAPENSICPSCDWFPTCGGGCRERRRISEKRFGEDMDPRCPKYQPPPSGLIPEAWLVPRKPIPKAPKVQG